MKKFLLALLLLPSLCFGQAIEPAAAHIWEAAAFGEKPGITFLNITGLNGAITTSYEPLWAESATYTFLTANQSSPTVSSSSANDAAAGTGARTVTITCVDSNYAITTGTYSLNGTSGVSVTQNCMSVNNMTVATFGSNKANAGVIYIGTGSITAGKPAVVHGLIDTDFGQSQMGIYTVPASYTLLCRNFTAASYGVTAAQTVDFTVDRYVNGGGKLINKLGFLNQAGSSGTVIFPGILKFAEKSQIRFNALSAASTGPVMLSADCLLISNTWEDTGQGVF